MENVNDVDIVLDRIASIVNRWDKPQYTADSIGLRGLISELRQVIRESQNTDIREFGG